MRSIFIPLQQGYILNSVICAIWLRRAKSSPKGELLSAQFDKSVFNIFTHESNEWNELDRVNRTNVHRQSASQTGSKPSVDIL